MRRLVSLLVAIVSLAACAPATATPEAVVTVASPVLATVTPAPAFTASPTTITVLPTATIPPLEVVPVPVDPLALTEFNAGTEMKRLNVIGTGTPHDLEFSPDGKLFAVATGRGVYLYDGVTFEPAGFIDVNDSVSALAFSPAGDVLAVAVEGQVSLWSLPSGRKLLDFDGGMVSIYKLAYSPNGFVAAIGSDCRGCGSAQQAMILWDAKDGSQTFSQHEIWYSTQALAFTSDGKYLAFGGREGLTIIEPEIIREDGVSPTDEPQVSAAMDMPFDVIFNTQDTPFVTSFDETSPFALCDSYMTANREVGACMQGPQTMAIFDLSTGNPRKTLEVAIDISRWYGVFALSPNSRYLAYGSENVVSIVDLQMEQLAQQLEFTSFDAAVAGMVLIEGIEKYVAAVKDPPGQIRLLELQTGETVRILKLECCEITGFAFAGDHQTGATVSENMLQLWDLPSQKVIYEQTLGNERVSPMMFSPDASKVYLARRADAYILEFDLRTRELKQIGKNFYAYDYADPFTVDNFHFNEQGNLILLEYENNNGQSNPSFRDIVTNQKLILPYPIVADPDFVESFALSPDGSYLVFGNPNGIFVWDTETRQQLWFLNKHELRGGDGWMGAIQSLQFNPQSNLLVSVGWDKTTRLWSVATGNELRTLHVCCSASFTPDGRYLVTAGDGVLRVWGIPH